VFFLEEKVDDDLRGRRKPSRIVLPKDPKTPLARLPSQYPHYLKPIEVNTRNVHGILERQLARNKPKLMRWLYSTWTAQREAIKYQEIRNAAATGELSAKWMDQWRRSYTKLVNEQFDPQWRAGMVAGATPVAEGISKVMGKLPTFSANAARISSWIDQHGGKLIVEMANQQERAVRNVIRHMVVDRGVGSVGLAEVLRPMVGLTEYQSNIVLRYREALAKAGVAKDKQTRLVQNYAAYHHRIRAERIARTEIAFAFNAGAFEQVQQARNEGIVTDPVEKIFSTAKDERVCPVCGPLDGQRVGFDETFPGGTPDLPFTYYPPLHPRCRCILRYVILRRAA
jgi:SPP1 gp7 family putative phage head morphogenesis protein